MQWSSNQLKDAFTDKQYGDDLTNKTMHVTKNADIFANNGGIYWQFNK